MKFASIGHLIDKESISMIPKQWIQRDYIISPELQFGNAKGHVVIIPVTAQDLMQKPRDKMKNKILGAVLFAQDNLRIDLVQLGGLTTSVTDGGIWFLDKDEYHGYVNHGDSYTAAVVVQNVKKILHDLDKHPEDLTLKIIGAYGIIGEAVSSLLVPQFANSILIGRRLEKFKELKRNLTGNYQITTNINNDQGDVVITATNHPTALLQSKHLKHNAVVVDVSQPPNLSKDICDQRTDVIRVDGGFVDHNYQQILPGNPQGKILSCIAEIIMQTMEEEKNNHVGSIDINHLYRTEEWAKKYGFNVSELNNFGKPIKI
jgi:fatty aldehyde-generating acyl-ACP reductase